MKSLILSLEERCLNAWPSLQTMHYDGWILRFSARYTRRANSINPLYTSSLPLLEKIRYCEQRYTETQQDTVFKMTSAVQPIDLDALLETQGYREEARTSVQTLDLAALRLSSLPSYPIISLSTQLTDEWIEAFCRLSEVQLQYRVPMLQMLANIVPDTCYASLQQDGQTVAVGLAVSERGYVGLFDIATAAAYRRHGFGTQLILGLLRWGENSGASQAYLQVMCSNAPALNLYAKLGFKEVYQYWYRVKK